MNAIAEQNSATATPDLGLAIPPAQGQLPGVPGISQADVDALAKAKAIELKQRQDGAIVRFESSFRLETEVIGAAKSTKRKVSKSGAVTLGLLPLNAKDGLSMASISGMKGEELKAFSRMQSDALKTAEAQLMTRLQGDVNWTGHSYALNAKGNEITLKLKKVDPIGVSLTKEMSEEEMLKKLGLTPEEYAPIKAAKAAAAAKAAEEAKLKAQEANDEANAAKELAELERQLAEEEAKVAQSASKNGEVEQVNPAE